MKKRQFGLFGKEAKYQSLSWWENFMGGHISLGRITIYGANAMCWTVNISTKRWGYICFTLPSIARKKRKWGHKFYLSPNGTPWASTYYRGKDKDEQIRAKIRRYNLGHNFDPSDKDVHIKLRCINEKFSWFRINEYDLKCFPNV